MSVLLAFPVLIGLLMILAGAGVGWMKPQFRWLALGFAGLGGMLMLGAVGLFVVIVGSME